MKRKSLSLLYFIVLAVCGYAQTLPVLNVPGPEVGTLGMVHAIPLGHYTGIPDISIPLYDIKVGSFSLPVTARYHLSSVKPHTPPTSLGTGWALDAGGYIARSVRGICDERSDENGNSIGYYGHCHKLKDITREEFENLTIREIYGTDGHELSADEFSFNFCGYSGNFYLNETGNWTVISDYDIKVEFDEQTGFAYLDQIVGTRKYDQQTGGYDDVNSRIVGKWANGQHCFRFYSRFTLVTPDGCRFEFGGVQATEYSISYYNRSNAELIPTSWRLSKIVTPENRTITFTYNTSCIMVDIRYAPQYNLTVGENGFSEGGVWQNGRSGYAGFLIFPVCLEKIETPNEQLDFTSFPNSGYQYRYNDGSGALYWATKTSTPSTFLDESNLSVPFFDLLDIEVRPDESESGVRNKIAGKLRHLLLHRILIRSKKYEGFNKTATDTVRSIYFDYNDHYFPQLKTITVRPTAPRTGLHHNGQPLIPATDTVNRPPSYHFSYNGGLPEHPILVKTDPWGYYRGTSYRISDGQPETEIYPASLEMTQKGTLSQIIYPTGARTCFVYEHHDYSKQVADNHVTLTDNAGLSGGLRIAEIIEKDRLNKILSKKKYYYTDSLVSLSGSKSSGISSGGKTMSVQFNLGSSGHMRLMSSEPFGPPVTNFNTPDVGYSSVTEEMLDAGGNTLGYVRYRYSNYDRDIYNNEHLDDTCDYRVGITGAVIPTEPFSSRAAERGKLLGKEYYNAQQRLVKKENYRYEWTDSGYMHIAHWDLFSASNPDPLYVIDNRKYYFTGWMTSIYTGSYLPVEMTETEYFYPVPGEFTRKSFYAYNKYKMLSRDSTLASDATAVVTDLRYVCDDEEYNWMKDLHILSPLLKKTVSKDGMTQHEQFEYSSRQSGSKPIPYLHRKQSWTGNNSPKLLYEVLETDSFGNPTVIVEDGVRSTLCWSYDGQRLSYRRTAAADSTSLQYSYLYNNRLQLVYAQEPGKPLLYYDYDYLGRLSDIYYEDNDNGSPLRRPLKHYQYDYRYVVERKP